MPGSRRSSHPLQCDRSPGTNPEAAEQPVGWAADESATNRLLNQTGGSTVDLRQGGNPMPQDGRELILHWLRDAHAMENQSVQMLENQLPSLAGFPEFHASVERHAVLSRE